MRVSGERQQEVIRPDLNRSIHIGFQGASITSDAGFLLLRQLDEHYRVLETAADKIFPL